MARVAVVTDSTADIPPELLERFDIHVIPLSLHIDRETFEDRVTITPAEFMERLIHAESIPTTSQPSVARFQQLYGQLAETYDAIVSIHLSSRLSGTYQCAVIARDLMNGRLPISVIDSRSASMGLGFPVLRAAGLARRGKELDEIVPAVQQAISATFTIFLVDTLEYLRRGGRIGRAAEIVGSVLQLKPILRIEEGIVVPHARTRTRARALTALVNLVREFPRVGQLAILATPGAHDVGALAEALTEIIPREQMILSDLSPVVAAHVGPGCLGVVIYDAEPIDLRGVLDERER